MNLITSSPSNTLANFQAFNLNQTSLNIRTETGISLVTADGDKVTLSANSSIQANLLTYNYLGRVQGQSVAANGTQFDLAAAGGLAISVDGSLDKNELADIKKLVNIIAAAGKSIFAGNTDEGVKQLAAIDPLDSIASFQANLSYTQTATSLTSSQVSSSIADQPANQTDSVPAIPAPPASLFNDQWKELAELLDSNQGLATIFRRFAQLFDKLAHNLPLDKHEHALKDGIQSELSKQNTSPVADTPTAQAN